MAKKHAIYPYPVYEAHFADGTVERRSFYCEKTIDPGTYPEYLARLAKSRGTTMADGFIEQNFRVDSVDHNLPSYRWRDQRFADNHTALTDPGLKPNATKKRAPASRIVLKHLAEVLAWIEEPTFDGRPVLAARELLKQAA